MLSAVAATALALAAVYFVMGNRTAREARSDLAIEQSVLAAYDRMIKAAEARDLATLFAFLGENDRGAAVLGGRVLRTRADAIALTRENFQRVAAVKYQVAERHVTMLSADAALLVASGTSRVRLDDGREFTNPFAHTLVLLWQQGQWRVLHSHQSAPR